MKLLPLAASAALVALPLQVHAATLEDHDYLWKTLTSSGLSIYINPKFCWEDHELMGAYIGKHKALIVCQTNKTTPGKAVDWTADDLDTFRHEAHHFVQDCMVGGNFDSVLGPIYRDPVKLGVDVLSEDTVLRIIEVYSDKPSQTQVNEIEAFAVAALNDPIEQARDVHKFCF